MDCPSCQQSLPDDAAFCGHCGTSLSAEQVCGGCGRSNPPAMRFCLGCGNPLGEVGETAPAERDARDYTPKHLADKILQSKSALEGERKQVTVLFADVKSSMELQEDVDPEEWHGILNRFFEILADGVHRFEGTINQYTGDGVMALFGAPISHEDHAQRACYAALHLRDELRRYGDELRRRGLAFSTRMGLNSGEVVVGKIGDDLRMDYTAQGHTVGLAARVQQLAQAGGACLTSKTAGLVEGYFQLRDLGPVEIRGVGEPVRLYELEGMGSLRTRFDASRARGLSHFVGRHDEMSGLDAALERAVAGQGRVVGIVAHAGTGKSRLCFEFTERCRARGINVNVAHALPHGKAIPLMPVLDMLRAIFGITGRDTEQTTRDKIAGRMVLLDETLRDALPLMFEFLGVPDPERPVPGQDPEVRQKQLFEVLARITQARSRREPAVFLFEDLHWLDAASEDFVANLVDSIGNTRTLLLVNFRPEYQSPWAHKSYYQQLPLVPLGPEDLEELLGHLLGHDPSLEGLPELVLERTGGNPFFVEEAVHTLVESGSLEGSRGAYRLREPVHELALPDTVHAILAARIDRLAEREKQVLQSASVLGRTFLRKVLERVIDLPEMELEEALRALLSAEFLYEESLYPEVEYSFRHPLTQEVAARSQLKERRARVHARAARTVEELHADRVDAQAALIAHHWEEAGEGLEAARWHGRAAHWAGMSHFAEAIRHLRRVIELLENEPESPETIELGVEARRRLLVLLGRTRVEEERDQSAFIEEGRALAERSPDPRVRTEYLLGIGSYALFRGNVAEATERLEELVIEAEKQSDPELGLAARYFLVICNYIGGSQDRGAELAEQFLSLDERHPGRGDRLVGLSGTPTVHGFRALALARCGRCEEAARSARRAQEIAREQEDLMQLSTVETAASWAAGLMGDMASASAHGQRAVEMAERFGAPNVLGIAYTALAQAHRAAGRDREACDASEQIFERGALVTRLHVHATRALALVGLGRLDEALAAAEAGIAATRRAGASICLAECHHARARAILAAKGAPAAAEIEAALAEAEKLSQHDGYLLFQPHIHLARADLAAARGDAGARERELREAERRSRELEAPLLAEHFLQLLD